MELLESGVANEGEGGDCVLETTGKDFSIQERGVGKLERQRGGI